MENQKETFKYFVLLGLPKFIQKIKNSLRILEKLKKQDHRHDIKSIN
mgnify:CR=1 FL=1